MDKLYELLNEYKDIYLDLLELEYEKYDAVIQNNINILDEAVSKEQAHYLKIRGIEQKREKLVCSLGIDGLTFKEIISTIEDDNAKEKFLKLYNELTDIITDLKKMSDLLKTVIDVRKIKIKNALDDLGVKENTYNNRDSKAESYDSIKISRKI